MIKNNRILLSECSAKKLKMHSAFVKKKPNKVVEELIDKYLPVYGPLTECSTDDSVNNSLTRDNNECVTQKNADIEKKVTYSQQNTN